MTSTNITLRESQVPPYGTKVFLYAGGRGSGKTRAGVSWIVDDPKSSVVIARTTSDARQSLLEGESGIIENSAFRYIWGRKSRVEPLQAEENGPVIYPVSMDILLSSQLGQVSDLVSDLGGHNKIERVFIDEAQNLKLKDWKLLNELYPDAVFFLSFTPDTDKNKLLTHLYRRVQAGMPGYFLSVNETLSNKDALSNRYIEMIVSLYGNTKLGEAQLRGVYPVEHYA